LNKQQMWLKKKIENHWRWTGKVKVYIRRNFKDNRVTIDFMNSGPCVTYDYNGKWIIG